MLSQGSARGVRQATAAVLVIGVATSACTSTAEPALPPDPSAMVPLLAAAQGPRDVLPEGADGMHLTDEAEVAMETTRLLHAGEQEQFWVALDTAGNVCLLTLLTKVDEPDPAEDGLWATSCPPPDTFYRSGVSLRVSGSGLSGSLGQLIPADVEVNHPELVSSEGGETLSDHFVVRAPSDSRKVGDLTLERTMGGTFTLPAWT